jgi:hypothetical protein
VPSPREALHYMRTVSRGSPVDPRWSVPGMVLSRLRDGLAAEGSPLTLEDVMARADYRDLMTPKVDVGDAAPDFALPQLEHGSELRLCSLLAERPVALVFGSYT